MLALSCAGRSTTKRVSAPEQVKQYTYNVVNSYAHNPTSYTQGLYFHNGEFYESTGLEGHSSLQRVELKSGKVLQKVALDRAYFGEGIAMVRGKIYQLTWQSGVALVYDAATFKRVGEFKYEGEGWGLATDGDKLYMSDGSSRVSVVDADTFEKKSSFDVTISGRKVEYINEMEWIDGKIWANVYGSDVIVIFDPHSGIVEGVVDLTGILPVSDRDNNTDVLNGIAYDVATKRIFVTGKNWKRVFEIEIIER